MSRLNVFFAKIKNIVHPVLLLPSQLRVSFAREKDYTDLYLATCATMSVVVPSAAAYKVAMVEEEKLNEAKLMNRFKLQAKAYCTAASDRHIIYMGKEGDRTPMRLASSLLERDDELVNNKLSIVKGGGGVLSDGDVLVVPEMILYRGLIEDDIEAFIEYVTGLGAPSTSAIQLEVREKEAPKQVPKEAKEAKEAKETSGST